MKKLLKNHWKTSTTALIVASLIIMAIFGYGRGQVLVLAAIVLWAAFNLFAYSAKKGSIAFSKQKSANRNDESLNDDFTERALYEKALKLHFESRINDQLKSLYPEANWQWVSNTDPVKFALGGEFGRIKVFNIPQCDYIEIFQRKFGELTLNEIRVFPLGQIGAKTTAEEKEADLLIPEKKFSVVDWLRGVSGDELMVVVRELNSQGLNKMFVDESGAISIVRSGEKLESYCIALPDFPPEENWKELLETIKGEGLVGSFDKGGFCVEWNRKG